MFLTISTRDMMYPRVDVFYSFYLLYTMHRTGKVANYAKGCNKQKPSKIIIFCDYLLSENWRKNWWQSIWKLYAKLLQSVIRIQISSGSYIVDQRELPTGNEKILLPTGNNVRTHGNGSLLQITRIVYTYIILYTFRHIENQKV